MDDYEYYDEEEHIKATQPLSKSSPEPQLIVSFNDINLMKSGFEQIIIKEKESRRSKFQELEKEISKISNENSPKISQFENIQKSHNETYRQRQNDLKEFRTNVLSEIRKNSRELEKSFSNFIRTEIDRPLRNEEDKASKLKASLIETIRSFEDNTSKLEYSLKNDKEILNHKQKELTEYTKSLDQTIKDIPQKIDVMQKKVALFKKDLGSKFDQHKIKNELKEKIKLIENKLSILTTETSSKILNEQKRLQGEIDKSSRDYYNQLQKLQESFLKSIDKNDELQKKHKILYDSIESIETDYHKLRDEFKKEQQKNETDIRNLKNKILPLNNATSTLIKDFNKKKDEEIKKILSNHRNNTTKFLDQINNTILNSIKSESEKSLSIDSNFNKYFKIQDEFSDHLKSLNISLNTIDLKYLQNSVDKLYNNLKTYVNEKPHEIASKIIYLEDLLTQIEKHLGITDIPQQNDTPLYIPIDEPPVKLSEINISNENKKIMNNNQVPEVEEEEEEEEIKPKPKKKKRTQ